VGCRPAEYSAVPHLCRETLRGSDPAGQQKKPMRSRIRMGKKRRTMPLEITANFKKT